MRENPHSHPIKWPKIGSELGEKSTKLHIYHRDNVWYSTKQRIYEINRLSVSADGGHISGKAVGIYAQNNTSAIVMARSKTKIKKLSIGGCGILGRLFS